MENEIPSVKATTSKMITVLCLVLLLATVGLAGCNLLPELSSSPQEEKPTATAAPGEATPAVSPTRGFPPPSPPHGNLFCHYPNPLDDGGFLPH
jgi:hypothetical protein